MMSGPELPSKISSHEEALACLRRMVDDLRELRLSLNNHTSKKTDASSDLAPDPSSSLDYEGVIAQGFCGPYNHQWDQTMLQNFKLQIQPQAVPVSDLSILTKPTSRNTVASSDMSPHPSSGINSVVVIAQGFCGPSSHQQDQTMLRNFKL